MNQQGFGSGGALREHTIRRCGELIDAGQYDVGISLLRETLAKDPADARVLFMLGASLSSYGDSREAIRHLKFAAQLQGNNPEIYLMLSMSHRKLNQLRDAHQAIDRALAINPKMTRAIAFKATLYQVTGQVEKALDYVRSSMVDDADGALAVLFGQLARQLKRTSEGVDVVREAIARPEIDVKQRKEMNFVLGHLYDAEGEYDLAFECFQRGNTMAGMQKTQDFDAHIEKSKKEMNADLPRANVDGSRAVFIVGMPRSGTTLTEQVLASHPLVGGVGESSVINEMVHGNPCENWTQEIVDQCGERYLSMLSDAYPDPKIVRVCDKMPENYFFLGLIDKMLPGAHYIHCVRDARDTCMSTYFQNFGPRQGYARDLKTCAEQYLKYLQMMEYWREALDISIFDSKYEDLTSEPEQSVRALLEHIGLEFHPACMEHHKSKSAVHTASMTQIRSPIYKSSQQRWKNYEKHLGPMLEILDGV